MELLFALRFEGPRCFSLSPVPFNGTSMHTQNTRYLCRTERLFNREILRTWNACHRFHINTACGGW